MSAAPPRWATFDCYGTLVDWNAGIGAELARLLGDDDRAGLLARYHQIEPRIQREHPDWSYRDVMAAVLAELASEASVPLPDEERDALGQSLPGWPVGWRMCWTSWCRPADPPLRSGRPRKRHRRLRPHQQRRADRSAQVAQRRDVDRRHRGEHVRLHRLL